MNPANSPYRNAGGGPTGQVPEADGGGMTSPTQLRHDRDHSPPAKRHGGEAPGSLATGLDLAALVGELQGIDGRSSSLSKEAVRQLTQEHKSLPDTIARGFYGRVKGWGLSDLRLQAELELVKAAWRYDPKRGATFRTFARVVIEHRLTDLLIEASGMTSHTHRMNVEYEARREHLRQRTGREPASADVYDSLGWSQRRRDNHGRTLQVASAGSLDAISEAAGDLPRDPGSVDPATLADDEESDRRLAHALDQLDPAEKELLTQRYMHGRSQADLAAERNCTLHEVRRAEDSAQAKLKELTGSV